ncbi:hypothetical protein CLF_101161 [Clonorchis sinensis]|uniref:EF-hand domain-containing protein n=1 Tax=Clonorchis sinensis TaxID=79923 RepID=G7Y561_CLOSI|nr:hypothetical protein CLF_101161 [Clonorchis sinensis]
MAILLCSLILWSWNNKRINCGHRHCSPQFRVVAKQSRGVCKRSSPLLDNAQQSMSSPLLAELSLVELKAHSINTKEVNHKMPKLSEKAKQAILTVFDEIDNGDGKLTADELFRYLNKNKDPVTTDEAKAFITVFDKDKNGTIDRRIYGDLQRCMIEDDVFGYTEEISSCGRLGPGPPIAVCKYRVGIDVGIQIHVRAVFN